MRLRNFIILLFSLFLFIFGINSVYASSVFFNTTPKNITQGDIFIVNLIATGLDKSVNAVNGLIKFDNKILEAKEVSVGGSDFNLWVKSPDISNKNGTISFVGGSTDDIAGDANILKVVFFAKKYGEAHVNVNDNFLFYLSDGYGTPFSPKQDLFSINILKNVDGISNNEWGNYINKDKISPNPFKIFLGKDANYYNNKYFITFFSTDNETGIKHYEVKEGDGKYVVADSPYILFNQAPSLPIKVKAVDFAGNERVEELVIPASNKKKNYLYIFIVLFVGLIIYLFGRIFVFKIKTKH